MAEVDGFLESTMPLLTAAETALHAGDAGLRSTIWSHTDPVTLFGAAVTKSGWGEIGLTFDWLAWRFSNRESFEYEVIAAEDTSAEGVVADLSATDTPRER